jgi:hypothetical protein
MILLIVATSHNMETLAKEEESERIGGIRNEPVEQPCFSPCFLVESLKILLTRRIIIQYNIIRYDAVETNKFNDMLEKLL